MSVLRATKKREAALAAFTAAKTKADRDAALQLLSKASLLLARAQDAAGMKSADGDSDDADESEGEDEEESEDSKKSEPKKPMSKKDKSDADEGKPTKYKPKADAGDADEDEDESEDEDEESDSGDSDDDDDDSDDDDDDSGDDADGDDSDADEDEDESEDEDEDESEEEDEDEEARASAIAHVRSLLSMGRKIGNKKMSATARKAMSAMKKAMKPKSLESYKALRSTAQKVTGRRGTKAILGALEGLAANAEYNKKLAADVAKIKLDQKKDRVEEMLATYKGRVRSKEIDGPEGLRATAMKLGLKWLRANLEARPKLRTIADGPMKGLDERPASVSKTAAISVESLNDDQRKLMETAAVSAGMTLDQFIQEHNKSLAQSTVTRPNSGR